MKFLSKIFFWIPVLLFFSCSESIQEERSSKNYSRIEDGSYLDYVNPFIGTGGHGHTYPGVSTPFGMMQLSPDTRLEGWDGCGGYHYSDSIIYGFSHTHLSGTGVSDYGDVLLMPTSGKLFLNNGSDGKDGYKSSFSHDQEMSEVGEYSVYLKDHHIDVSLTCGIRSGYHSYQFNAAEADKNLVIDLEHRDRLIEGELTQLNDTVFIGKRVSRAWAEEQHVYFYLVLSEPSTDLKKEENSHIYGLEFDSAIENLEVRIGISAVDIDGAKNNLLEEIPNWDFAKTKEVNRQAWLRELKTIEIKDKIVTDVQKDRMNIFYTALYHSYLNPNTFSDVDGRYRGMDMKIHHLDPKYDCQYTVFSLWDTYRATHPLFTITQPTKTNQFIRTFLRQYQEGGALPIWELAGNYTGCMIGYHAIPVIADAYAKGYEDYDLDLAIEAMIHSAQEDKLGLASYKKYGFVLSEEESESVSKTLEYAYDDWCIYRVLKSVNDSRASEFKKRALNYKNVFDPSTGFMRAKINHAWFTPFDPFEVNYHYTEANAWQYSMYVPQDVQGHIDLFGGKERYEVHLDTLFSAQSKTTGREQADITGLIGQYAHGNEPSHHMAYLYNAVGKSNKTQEKVFEILTNQYFNSPDGLSGNEDCGQMSSWYVLSAIGLYPVAPGSADYDIGRPLFSNIEVHQGNQIFKIQSENLSDDQLYISSCTLNGQEVRSTKLSHKKLMGSELKFTFSDEPGLWQPKELINTHIQNSEMVPVPYFNTVGTTFTKTMDIDIGSIENSFVRFTFDGSPVNERSARMRYPIRIAETREFRARAYRNGNASPEIKCTFHKIEGGKTIELESKYANQYAAGGDMALIDYQRGSSNYMTGKWQGYQEDLVALVNLGQVKLVQNVQVGFLQDVKSWIWYPTEMSVMTSKDGLNYELAGTIKNTFSDREYGSFIQDLKLEKINREVQFVKIVAKNYGQCPEWHLGAGGQAWIFADEIVID